MAINVKGSPGMVQLSILTMTVVTQGYRCDVIAKSYMPTCISARISISDEVRIWPIEFVDWCQWIFLGFDTAL